MIFNMSNYVVIFFLILTTVLNMNLAQMTLVPIKSHKVLTNTITHNQINSIYDNNPDTLGSFYSSNGENAEVEFDLGKNYMIDHVLLIMKRETTIHNMSLLVGNTFIGQGVILYECKRIDELKDIYKCQPACRSTTFDQQGIIARKIIMKLKVSSNWISIYEIQVFSQHLAASDDISSNRLVQPVDCQSKSWLLTDKISVASLPTTTSTDIFFEKPFIITKLIIKFQNSSTKNFVISMINEQSKTKSVNITLSDCSLQRFTFTCTINDKTFPARQLKIETLGLTKLFIRGKPVFYPKLEIKTAFNMNEKLQITCKYSQCDLSTHSDCSEEAIKVGVKFNCVNKRLFRVPSASDRDSYVIVNRGMVESVWKTTNFTVESKNDDQMIVSMPRSYQYFGQYKCGCIVADTMNTEIMSDSTELREIDFLEELIFETKPQYKLSDKDDAVLQNVVNKVVFLQKSELESAYIPFKITMYSLIQGNVIKVFYPLNEKETDTAQTERSILHSVKAFDNIPQSWSVDTYKYIIEDIFPEFIHGGVISIICTSTKSILSQKEVIKMLDKEIVSQKPSMWTSDNDSKIMNTNIMYANTNEAKLYYSETACISTKTIVLATFTKNSCLSKDVRLTCIQFQGATNLLFKVERSFAKNMVLDLVDSTTNSSINRITSKTNITVNQDDVTIQPRYTKLTSSSTNMNINVLTVEMKVISKKIYDFIPCGKVEIEISIPNKNMQKMVLQDSVFTIDVEMTSTNISIRITVSIVDVRGSHVTDLQITDPVTFSADMVKFEYRKLLSLSWEGISEIANFLLQSYEMVINITTVACNRTVTDIKSIPKSQTSGNNNRYLAPIMKMNQNHMTEMFVGVQPVYTGNKRGQVIRVQRNSGTTAHSSLVIDARVRRSNRTITVIPSQSDTSCDIKDVLFNITGVDIEKFDWKAVPMGNMQYKITNLVPGRRYRITAKVLYKYGPDDSTSKSYTFETADDISIIKQKHVAEINDLVNISCTAEIGPGDKFQKSVHWLRSDTSLLPDGVKSVQSTFNPREVFLIMEKASADYSGEYGCFAQPSATTGWMSISIVVNDLVVNPTTKNVDFNGPLKNNVSVTCSSSAAGENNLIWMDQFENIIPDGESLKYSIKNTVTDQKVHKSTLTIKELSLNTTGIYKCRKAIGNMGADKEFFLYGNESLTIERLTNNSDFVGEKQRLRCSAKPGLYSQTVVWETYNIDHGEMIPPKISFPNPSDKTIQDIEILNSLSKLDFICKLSPIISNQLSKTYRIELKSKIVVKGPTKVYAGTNVILTCLGYPQTADMQLKWIFYATNQTNVGKTIVTSEKPSKSKSYEPIKLNLNITDVKNTEAGRYECLFEKPVSERTFQKGHSINLVVNTVLLPFEYVKKCALKILFGNLPITFVYAILISFVVRHQ